jgi:hypothetical protein
MEHIPERIPQMPCSLSVPNPARPRKFAGKTGSAVSLSVRGTAGSASFTGGFYAGAAIPINPAKFTIVAGDNVLDLVVENTLTEDKTQVVCDADGSVLFDYLFDRNNPAQIFEVIGS